MAAMGKLLTQTPPIFLGLNTLTLLFLIRAP